MQDTVIVEQGATSWGAYVPDLPGCIAAGDSHSNDGCRGSGRDDDWAERAALRREAVMSTSFK